MTSALLPVGAIAIASAEFFNLARYAAGHSLTTSTQRASLAAAPGARRGKSGAPSRVLTVTTSARVARTAVRDHFIIEAIRPAVANQRFGRSGRLRTRFTFFALTPLKVARAPASLLSRGTEGTARDGSRQARGAMRTARSVSSKNAMQASQSAEAVIRRRRTIYLVAEVIVHWRAANPSRGGHREARAVIAFFRA